jgi:hypothetical protein
MSSTANRTNKDVLYRILPYLIVISIFLTLGCLSAYFLHTAIIGGVSQASIRLWAIILSISFLIVLITTLVLLISYSSRKRKQEEDAAVKEYVESLKTDLASEYDDDGDDVFYCSPEQLKRALNVTDFFPQYVHQMSADTSSVKRFRIKGENNAAKKLKGRINIKALMIDNLGKMKEYYDWSKNQAVIMFGVAVGACIVGTLIVIASFVLPIVMKLSFETTLITAIGGLITDVFAGTTLIVYRSSVKQINRYHDCMHEDQRFLCAVDLLDRFSSTKKRDDALIEIIQNQLAINLACAKDGDEEEEEADADKPATEEATDADSSDSGNS